MKYKQMMIGALLLSGCSHSLDPNDEVKDPTSWYEIGFSDAQGGLIVRDNETLAEWYGNPHINRDYYLSGYHAGQQDLCQPARLKIHFERGDNFPASCDSVKDAEILQQIWIN
ncbi:hypothetical protein PL78_14760 [Yersinia entomophaga]|uniref:Lipoprotein n=1 Tax=Yersinia entomophaga TaxID=935293 RepID=A0ABM6BNE8_YERET|nr:MULTISPECIES: DUF2799 domain-containing protein [Yersinia]ANI31078.1 hypothetical protein PL78_14760 [Yersinia entomophaga]OWF84678.1 hypothetical protein B4914_18750 [Yersinia entomophaga]